MNSASSARRAMRDQGQRTVLGADAGHDVGYFADLRGFYVDGGHILGVVTLSGVWRGRIEVRMAEGLAYKATAALLHHRAKENPPFSFGLIVDRREK